MESDDFATKLRAQIDEIERRFLVWHNGQQAVDWVGMRNKSQTLFAHYAEMRQELRDLQRAN